MYYFLISLFLCSIRMSIIALAYLFVTPLLMKRYAVKWCYYTWLIIVLGYAIPYSSYFKLSFVKPSFLFHLHQNIHGNLELATTSGFINVRVYQITGIIWLCGVVLFMIYYGIRHYRFLTMVNRWGVEATDLQMLSILEQMRDKVKVKRQIKLKLCPFITSPMMTGVFKPVILLPSKSYSAHELSFILNHELVHYKRRDLWYKGLVVFTNAIHWFNPVVYIMAKAIASQCEISCDAEVVKDRQLRERHQYSQAIIGVIKYQSRLHTIFSSNFNGGIKDLKKRILSIMDTGRKKAGIVVLCIVVLATATVNTIFAKDITTPINSDYSVLRKSKIISEEIIIDSDKGIRRKIDEKEYIGNKYL